MGRDLCSGIQGHAQASNVLVHAAENTPGGKPRPAPGKWGRRILKLLAWIVLLPGLLLALLALLLYLPPVQQLLRTKAVVCLEEKIGTPVQLERIALRFPLGLSLSGLLVEQQNGDTLLYAGGLRTRASLTALLRKEIFLSSVDLEQVRAIITQDRDSVFNFDYIAAAFQGDEPATEAPADTTGGWGFSLGALSLERIHLDLELAPAQLELALYLGELDLAFNAFAPADMRFHVDRLRLADTQVALRMASGPPEPDPYPQLVNPLAGIDVRFNELRLARLGFAMKDVVKGDSLWLQLPDARVEVERMDLAQQQIALSAVELDSPVLGMRTPHQGEAVDTVQVEPPWLEENDGFRYYVRDHAISVGSLRIAGGTVALYADTIAAPEELFDAERLLLQEMHVEVAGLRVHNERIGAEKVGVDLRTGPDNLRFAFEAEVDAAPQRIALERGRVELAGNRLSLAAVAEPTGLAALYRHPDQVPFRLELRATLDPGQLRPLLAEFGASHHIPAGTTEQWATAVDLAGSVAQLDTARLEVQGTAGSVLLLAGRMRHVDQWPRTDFEVALSSLTLGEGFRQLLQAAAPAGVRLPQQLTMAAHATGKDGNMQARMNVDSDLGAIAGRVQAAGWKNKLPDRLAVDLGVQQLAAGHLTGDTALGPVSAHLSASAAGLDGPTRSGTLLLQPSQLRYRGHDLSSLELTGSLEGDSLFVHLAADAEPVKMELDASGKWPAQADSLALQMDLALDRLKLEELGLVAHPLDVQGGIHAELAMSTTGKGQVGLTAQGLQLANADRAFQFTHFDLQAYLGTDSTALILDSDGLTVDYHTNLAVDSILPRTRDKLASYFKADPTFRPTPGKYMDLAITLPNSDWLTGLVLPGLQTIRLDRFTGHYDSEADALDLQVEVPELRYDSIRVEALGLRVDAEGNDLDARLSVGAVTRDSLAIRGLTLASSARVGGLTNSLRVQNGEFPPSYVLNVLLERADGRATLHVEPEELVLDGQPWIVDPANRLHFGEQGLVAEHFTLHSAEQRLELATNADDTRILVDQFRVGTLLNFVTAADSVPFVEGTLTGHVDLPKQDREGLEAKLDLDAWKLLGNALGDLRFTVQETGQANYAATLQLENGPNTVSGKATVDVSSNAPDIQGSAVLDFTDLGTFRPFTSSFLYALDGGLNGELRFNMAQGKAALNGDLTFEQARIGLLATRSAFRLEEEHITFNDAGIQLDDFTLKDSLNNTFRLNGTIGTADLADPSLDLRLYTDVFQLVNSTRGNNELFYGDVLAGLDLSITGTAALPKLQGEVQVLDGTDLSIVLPGSEVKMISHEGIVVFTNGEPAVDTATVASDGKLLQDSLKAQLQGFELDLHLLVDPGARFSVVLDPTTGDAASFRGEGDLYFTYNAEGDMTLTGPFTVEDGGYTLEFYGLVKKRFDLVKGSSVVWSGDPLDAKIDIQARYTAEAAAYGLVAGSTAMAQEQQNRLQQRLPFAVIISVDGSISTPDIDLGIDLDREYRNSYPMVAARLEQLEQPGHRDDRNRQVFGLLVTNAFIPDEGAGAAPSGGLVSSAARNSVNGILTDQLNKLTGRYVKGVDVSLGVNTVDQAEGNATYQRTSVDYKVSKSFLNDRLSFEVGGSVGVDEQQDQVGNVSNTRAAQYVVYYDLTPNGRYRLRGFHENAFELYDGEITKSGVAIQYTKDFEENERARSAAREAARKRLAAEKAARRKDREGPDDPAGTPKQEQP